MSKIIISAAIRGAHNIVGKAAAKLDQAIQKYGENQEIGFPNTAYYLPIIYSLMGTKIEKLKDAVPVMARRIRHEPVHKPPAALLDLHFDQQ